MKGWKVDLLDRLVTHKATGLRFRFTPVLEEPGMWAGECIDLHLAEQLIDLTAPDVVQQLARLNRESTDAFAEKLGPQKKKTFPIPIRMNPWELAVLEDAARKVNIDSAAYIRTRALAAAKNDLTSSA